MTHRSTPLRGLRRRSCSALGLGLALATGLLSVALAQAPHGDHGGHAAHAMPADARQPVRFPPPMKAHTLANMRDHLLALTEIQDAMARGDFDAAGGIAEQRLGLSALRAHGAHEVAGFMPKGMQEAGTAMHRAASRFAIAAQDAAAGGDARAAQAALVPVMQACVACHAGYRFE